MRICKYCNKPIAEKDIWNPDNDGNGYHHECLIDMEFKARDRQIYNKGKIDVLDKIRAEILDNAFLTVNPKNTYEFISAIGLDDIDKILDKYRSKSEDKE